MNDDPLVPVASNTASPENSASIPVAYQATYGNWTSPYQVKVYRSGQTAFYTNPVTTSGVTSLWIYNVGTSGNPDAPVFNITEYQNLSRGPDTNYDPTGTWTGYKYGFGKIDSGQSGVAPQLPLPSILRRAR